MTLHQANCALLSTWRSVHPQLQHLSQGTAYMHVSCVIPEHPAAYLHAPYLHFNIFLWQCLANVYWINADIRAIRIIGHVRDVITGPFTSKSFVIQLYKYGFCQMDCYYLVQTQKASAVLCMWSLLSPYQEGMAFELFCQQWWVTVTSQSVSWLCGWKTPLVP